MSFFPFGCFPYLVMKMEKEWKGRSEVIQKNLQLMPNVEHNDGVCVQVNMIKIEMLSKALVDSLIFIIPQ